MKELLRFLAERGTVVAPDVAAALGAPGAPAPGIIVQALRGLPDLPFVLTREDLARVGIHLAHSATPAPSVNSNPITPRASAASPTPAPATAAPASRPAAPGAPALSPPPTASPPPATRAAPAASPPASGMGAGSSTSRDVPPTAAPSQATAEPAARTLDPHAPASGSVASSAPAVHARESHASAGFTPPHDAPAAPGSATGASPAAARPPSSAPPSGPPPSAPGGAPRVDAPVRNVAAVAGLEHLGASPSSTRAASSLVSPSPAPRPLSGGAPAPRSLDPRASVAAGRTVDAEALARAPALASRFAAYAHQVEILSDVTGNSTCEGDIQDFAKYFNDRLNKLRKLLRGRREMAGMIPIKNIRPGGQAEVKIAGIVTEVRQTKNGHRLIEIEDDTGTAAVLALQSDHRLIEDADLCLDDEVVGIIAKPSTKGDLLILQRIIRPDVPLTRDPRRSTQSSAVAFISDIHFGSKTFLADDWERFVRWINGEFGDSAQRALAEKTKYLVVCGDVVDGIGIFPGQEEELAIDDGLAQYDFAGEQFARIRRPDLKIIVQPGNHDLVRPAEPQPAFPTKYRRTFPENVTFVGNPCRIAIEGVEILGYHGMSFVDWITRIPGLSFEDPVRVMKEMVTRRHVAPIYGLRTPLAPEHKDYLAMDFVPDIFETGHVHAAGMETFRGIHLINSSCWQSQTAYQKMHGFQPEPARVPVVELDNGTPHFLDFHGGRPSGVDVVGRSAFGENWKDKTMGGGQWQT